VTGALRKYRDVLWALKAMPASELAARARLALRTRASRVRWSMNLAPDSHPEVEPGSIGHIFPAVDPDVLRSSLQRIGALEPLVAQAEAICSGQVELFPGWTVRWEKAPPWHATHPGAGQWSRGHFSTARAKLSELHGLGDVKYTWELNRHQYLCAPARAYAATAGEDHARVCAEHLGNWISENPFPTGINWANALEVAVRAISWLWLYHCLAGAASFRRLSPSFLSTLARHGRYLEAFCTEGLNPNNHVIGEACGLFCLGAFFRDTSFGEPWLDRGRRLLESHILIQTFPTGESREQSVWYHRFVTDFFLLAYSVAERIEAHFSDAYRTRLAAMLRALAGLTHPDGCIPGIGDSDQGRAYEMTTTPREDAGPTLSAGAAILGEAELVPFGRELDEEAVWLTGPEVVGTLRQAKRTARAHERPLEVRGNGWSWFCWQGPTKVRLLFDVGPQGLGRVAPHGHADALSITLRLAEEDVVVDPGTYAYNRERRWRDFFRGTRAHNTVVVDGLGQAEPIFTFRWRRAADARCEFAHQGEMFDYVRGVHRGYERLRDPVTHKRHVLGVRGRCFVILDDMIGEAEHEYTARIHFAPGTCVTREEGSVEVTAAHRAALCAMPFGPGSFRIAEGEADPIEGWYSPSYGVRTPCPVLVHTWRAKGRCMTGAILIPYRAGEEKPRTSVEEEGRRIGLVWEEVAVTFVLRPPGERVWEVGDQRTDADALVNLQDAHVSAAAALGGSFLEHQGRRYIDEAGSSYIEVLYHRG